MSVLEYWCMCGCCDARAFVSMRLVACGVLVADILLTYCFLFFRLFRLLARRSLRGRFWRGAESVIGPLSDRQ